MFIPQFVFIHIYIYKLNVILLPFPGPEKLYVDGTSKINTSNYANGSSNLLSLGKITFIGIAFENFKTSLIE